METIRNKELLYPELSYQTIGTAFDVFNTLGWGHKELYYQRAFAEGLKKKSIPFTREHPVVLKYEGSAIGKYVLDFIVDGKIVVELKVAPRLGYANVKQVKSYLVNTGLKLALLVYFTKDGVKYRRIVNAR
jgi:GxxExxY protein